MKTAMKVFRATLLPKLKKNIEKRLFKIYHTIKVLPLILQFTLSCAQIISNANCLLIISIMELETKTARFLTLKDS